MRYRVFAALELPPDKKQRLAELVADLSAAVPRRMVRWVNTDSLHLTLKFYGDIQAEQVPEIEAGLGRLAAGAAPLRLGIEGLGVFPDPHRPQVVWAGLVGDLKPLKALQSALDEMSEQLGFPREARPFTPHLTLGRVNGRLRPPDQMALLDQLNQARDRRLGEFEADRLALMRSDLRPTGAVYTALYVAPLGSEQRASDNPAT